MPVSHVQSMRNVSMLLVQGYICASAAWLTGLCMSRYKSEGGAEGPASSAG